MWAEHPLRAGAGCVGAPGLVGWTYSWPGLRKGVLSTHPAFGECRSKLRVTIPWVAQIRAVIIAANSYGLEYSTLRTMVRYPCPSLAMGGTSYQPNSHDAVLLKPPRCLAVTKGSDEAPPDLMVAATFPTNLSSVTYVPSSVPVVIGVMGTVASLGPKMGTDSLVRSKFLWYLISPVVFHSYVSPTPTPAKSSPTAALGSCFVPS